MKICILTHSENVDAGWGRYSVQVVSGLRARGHRVVVLTEHGGEYPILRRGLGVFWSALRVILHLRKCDIVHALDVYPFGIIAWLATRIMRRPYVLSGIGTYSVAPLSNTSTSWMAKRACHSAAAILAISSYTASLMRSHVPTANIRVIHPGISNNYYPLERNHLPLRIISVGALKERKGYHVAIEAFARAKTLIPSLLYTIVGDQRDRVYFARLQALVKRLGVADSVVFKQKVGEQELLSEYCNAGIFLLPSINVGAHFEGFGLVFLEAAACGLPVIGTVGNGISDAVGPDNGVLVPQSDVESTARAITKILSDVSSWKKMSAASVVWANNHLSGSMIDMYERCYYCARSR